MRQPRASRAARRLAVWASVASMIVLAACGGDDDDTTEPADTATEATDTGENPTETSPAGSAPADTAGEEPSEEPAGEAVVGGTLIFAQPVDTGCLDPAQLAITAILSTTRAFADGLTYLDPETHELLPWLAESWEVSDDVTTFTFHLRDDVTFSDGTPLTAEVVGANFDAIFAMGALSLVGASNLVGYVGSTAIDEHTVAVEFDHPNAQFLITTSYPPLSIFSASTAAATPEERCQGNLIGTGPFVLDSYTPSQSAIVSRRDGYAWAPATFANQGEAYLDGIEFRSISDASVRSGSLVAGDVHIDGGLQQQDIDLVYSAGADIIPTIENPGLPVGFQISRARMADATSPLSDVAVRRAMMIALDREALVKTFVGGRFEIPSVSSLTSTSTGFTDIGDLMAYDPEGAEAILDEAGWVAGSDGIRAKDGTPLSLELQYLSPVYDFIVPLMSLAQQQLREIGVDLSLYPLPPAEGQERYAVGNYDLDLTSRNRVDPGDALSLLRGISPDLDELLDQQNATPDLDERLGYLATAQEIAIRDALTLPVYGLVAPNAVASNVHGFAVDASNLWQFNSTWLDA